MAKIEKKSVVPVPFFAQPMVGTLLTVASGVSFLFLCMILPIVGPAAAFGSGSPGATRAVHYTQNFWAFLGVLVLSMVLGGLAVFSKLERRKIDGSPLPVYSIGLCGILVLVLVALFTGLLSI